jgi:bifunctional UDP-N-acetylglucosamine pyrophosphorylase / glucosamine-1-phosphate N-acetyltransferase
VSVKQGEAQSARLGAIVIAVEAEKGRRAMALREAGGKTLLEHVAGAVGQVIETGAIVTILDPEAEVLQAAIAATGTRVEILRERQGLGQALGAVAPNWQGFASVLLIAGDAARIGPEALQELVRKHAFEGAAMTLPKMAGHGSNADGAAMCVLKTDLLRAHLDRLDAAKLEVGIAQLAAMLRGAGKPVGEHELKESEGGRVRTIAELVELDRCLRLDTAKRLMAEGVTIFLPETCVIDAEVEVGTDTVIEPFVQLRGKTKVGANSRIRSYSVIENCVIGSRVLVLPGCVMADSTVEDGARLGPYTHLRPGCAIGEDAHMGNFVEGKKARLGKGAKANHLTYLGDVEVGARSNIGAGVITCNYDGAHKHQTRIGEGAFVGSDSTLVAPVSIEAGAYVGAGSCITKDVPAGALAVGRARQVIKEGWADARRARQKSPK